MRRETVESGAGEGLVRGFFWSYPLLLLPALLLPAAFAALCLRARAWRRPPLLPPGIP